MKANLKTNNQSCLRLPRH
uniref:Uncharacterized protein n=1 Tax=Rhizophora mucronata TaxID=61149 RepID=A0A2P2NWV1_RHIMU